MWLLWYEACHFSFDLKGKYFVNCLGWMAVILLASIRDSFQFVTVVYLISSNVLSKYLLYLANDALEKLWQYSN